MVASLQNSQYTIYLVAICHEIYESISPAKYDLRFSGADLCKKNLEVLARALQMSESRVINQWSVLAAFHCRAALPSIGSLIHLNSVMSAVQGFTFPGNLNPNLQGVHTFGICDVPCDAIPRRNRCRIAWGTRTWCHRLFIWVRIP